ncbi:hypothetical protein [Corallococcus macrosporus]|nr:hypothetical protein [Corallococcus macrosporus]
MTNARHSRIHWGPWCALLAALVSPPALAAAGKREAPEEPSVVVLAMEGDARHRLGTRLEPAPRATRRVRVAAQGRDEATRGMKVEPESHTPTEPLLEVSLDTGSGGTVGEAPARPPLARLTLSGTTTWRNYCARPGVKSCGEYDGLPANERLGDTVSYSSSVPYLGVAAELELLPLARGESPLRGLGLSLGYRRGFSSTHVTLVGDAGQSTTREVAATDSVLTAQALYRYFFGMGASHASPGYAGLRAGLLTRAFDVDASADSHLTGTHRLFPAVGLEVSVPLLRQVRLEGAGQFFFSPKPGTGLGGGGAALDAEVGDYGTSVSSFGWEAELGVGGELWGPFGYAVRFRLSRYQDTFSGAGTKRGWDDGGVAAETYSSLHWGLTASY